MLGFVFLFSFLKLNSSLVNSLNLAVNIHRILMRNIHPFLFFHKIVVIFFQTWLEISGLFDHHTLALTHSLVKILVALSLGVHHFLLVDIFAGHFFVF